MVRRKSDIFERKNVIELIRQHLDGSIKTLKSLKIMIEEVIGKTISLAAISQQVQKTKKQLSVTSGKSSSYEPASNDDGDGEINTTKAEDRNQPHKSRFPDDIITPLEPDLKRTRQNFTVAECNKKSLVAKKSKKIVTEDLQAEEINTWDESREETIRSEAMKKLATYYNDSLLREKSKVWLFCEKIDNNGKEAHARCKICGMIMVQKLGSTRAMLRHLRKMHYKLIEGVIRPVTRRVSTIAGKPRISEGFDIDDESAWVEEVVHDYPVHYQEQQAKVGSYFVKNENEMVDYENFGDEQCPSFAGEVFIHEDGSYVTEDGEEFVDVVYVQDGRSVEDECVAKEGNVAMFSASKAGEEPSARCDEEEFVGGSPRLSRSTSDSQICYSFEELAESTDNQDNHLTEISNDGDLNVLECIKEEEWLEQNKSADVDYQFGHTIALSLKTFPVERRNQIKATLLDFIAHMHETYSNDDQ